MKVQSTQVKITLPTPVQVLLKQKAAQLGMTLSGYIKHIAIDDIKTDPHTFTLSKTRENEGLKALEEHKQGKTTQVTSFDTFLDNL